jgi:RND superfamily putative drug exporter
VAFGLEKPGRLISSAAAIMVIAFTAFLVGHVIQLKEFGFAMLAAIALDATLIRIVLVPSIMEVMGDWNWWVPGFLRGFARGGVAAAAESGAPAENTHEPASV